ncbi:hypothetical protein IWX49DRAFT_550149 [Phyllosticta citricarpa]|uniref:Uncharacterized protein n=2 Tax=Phyllosticta TaxID=121621 RepID=A0ABR1MR48_9PEZI
MAALRGLRRRLSSMLNSSRNLSTGALMTSTESSCDDSSVSSTSGSISGPASLDSDRFCFHSVDAPMDVDAGTSLLDFINDEVSLRPSLTQLPTIEQLAFAKYLLRRAREQHSPQESTASTAGDWLRALSLGLSLRSKCDCNSPALHSTESTYSGHDADDECGLGIFGISGMRSASISSESSMYRSDDETDYCDLRNYSTVSLPQVQDAVSSFSPSIYSQSSGSETDSPSSSYSAPSGTLHRRASAPSLSSRSAYSFDFDAWTSYTWSTCSAHSSPMGTPRPPTASSYARLALVPSFNSAAPSSGVLPPSSSPFFQTAYKSVYSPNACDALSLCRHPSAAAWSVAQLSLCDVKVGMLGRWVKGRVNRQVGGKVRRGWRRVKMGAFVGN